MYITTNPYTGRDLRASKPSLYTTWGMRGLGQIDPTTGDSIDFSSGAVNANDPMLTVGTSPFDVGTVYNPTSYPVVGGSSFNASNPLNTLITDTGQAISGGSNSWINSLVSGFTNIGTTLTKNLTTPGGSYTITNPNGTVTSYQGTGVASSNLSLPNIGGSIDMTTMLLLGGGALLLVMMMGKGH